MDIDQLYDEPPAVRMTEQTHIMYNAAGRAFLGEKYGHFINWSFGKKI